MGAPDRAQRFLVLTFRVESAGLLHEGREPLAVLGRTFILVFILAAAVFVLRILLLAECFHVYRLSLPNHPCLKGIGSGRAPFTQGLFGQTLVCCEVEMPLVVHEKNASGIHT